MNKLNNKGLTLIELIISISLISIVMLFLYRLLANINYDSDNDYFASFNQEQRIEMIDYIETLLRKAEITEKPKFKNDIGDFATIQITQADISENYLIEIHSSYIKVTNHDDILRVWDLEKGVYSYQDAYCNSYSSSSDQFYPYVCTIPVYTVNIDNNANNNNTLDDITISFLVQG